MGRAPCCDKVGLKKGKWTEEEDEILVNYIKVHGEGSWRSLPKKAGLLRCGKSCRLRWINYLRSGLKRGNFSEEEEDLIIKLHTSLGNKWSQIASKLPGRTDNDIKNYWNTHLSRSICYYQQVNRCKKNSEVMPVKPLKSSNKNSAGKNYEKIAQTTKNRKQRKITAKVLNPESLSLTKHCDEKAESEFSSMTDADAINTGPSSSIKFDNSEFSCTTDEAHTSKEEKRNELSSPDLSEFLRDMEGLLNYESKEADTTVNWNNDIFGDIGDGNLLAQLDEEVENWGYLDSLWDLDLCSSFRL